MSRYPPVDFRGSRDRSRSPPRFADRRPSAASIFDGRPQAPPRTASDLPRGPRPSFDGQRPPLNVSPGPPSSRPSYSLRDAPPLGSGDRSRSYREREYRAPSPRDRSPPPRGFKDSRDFPPRDIDHSRNARDPRDGPLSAGSNHSDSRDFSGSGPPRGGFTRGRGRGESFVRGGRGGRSLADDRDLFSRRDRSPPPRWDRDLSRDSRDSDRRDERRFERRDDDRRPLDWPDRERDRDPERIRRDPAPQRLESRTSNESLGNSSTAHAASQSSQINPQRLALIESNGADANLRRQSIQSDPPGSREARKDPAETPAYLTGRAETTANRYGSRGSSPPTQAPPSVPAFGFSFAPPAAQAPQASQPLAPAQAVKPAQEVKSPVAIPDDVAQSRPNAGSDASPTLPIGASTASKISPAAPKAHIVSPPPASAPKAPRALEIDEAAASNVQVQNVKPSETVVSGQPLSQRAPSTLQADNGTALNAPPSVAQTGPLMHSLLQPAHPAIPQAAKANSEIQPPTGPRASRVSPALPSVSPRAPFTSPRFDTAAIGPAGTRPKTPPPAAPSGPRNRAFSTSPQAVSTTIPTQPKANRIPPFGGRPLDRPPLQANRALEKPGAQQPWVPPSGPRNQPQWHQWRRPNAPIFPDKTVPAKRDIFGEEKGRIPNQPPTSAPTHSLNKPADNALTSPTAGAPPQEARRPSEATGTAQQPPRRQTSIMAGQSGKQSWLGKPLAKEEEASNTSDNAHERSSSSDDDDSDPENHLALLHAKFQKQRRLLEARMVDLSARSYRATTPRENLARLARISTRDLERLNEQVEHAMDVDKSPITQRTHTLPQSRRSSDSVDGPNVRTPDDEEDNRVRIRSSDDSSDGVRRVRRPTPEPVSLPYLLKEGQPPLEQKVTFADALKEVGEIQTDVVASYDHWMQDEEDDLEHLEQVFDAEYRHWREECEQLDKMKEEQEKLERQQSLEPKPEMDAPSAVTGSSAYEGRRLYKFSSEYEMELVLKQSEETARIEQERQEREARKNQADMEKEATICDQDTPEEAARSIFIDNNRYRGPDELTTVFTYLPPPDDFTPNEQHVFLGAYKESPKKWGEIASLLPGRTYQDCIRHYYANKWDNRYRDRIKKRGPGRRGRGAARGPRGGRGLMADLRPHEDMATENMSEKGRPRRAAAPTTFAEKEAEAKATLIGSLTGKKVGGSSKNDSNGEGPQDKPGKRQKRTGEKPGRKSNKANQPILAAAPDGSPRKQFMPGVHSKEDLADANLLASLAGRNALNEAQMIYHQDGQMHHMIPHFEDLERSKATGAAPPAKQGPSSYWSVPEQNDFVKYIGHFGTDFHAIAQHMVTKSVTMIKNHYQRQVDGGNRPDLEQAARAANERRARGEDIGPPPAPTPIQKRKYENPPVPAQRAIAPQAENVDIDDGGPQQRGSTAKHASPQQYPPQPRFTSTMQQKPSATAARIVPSPLSSAATPMSVMSTAYQSKTMQNPLGTKMSFLNETRPEVVPNYRPTQESAVRNYLPQQTRRVPDPQDPEYMRNLAQERERAFRVQERANLSERPETFHLHPSIPRNPSHGSPLSQPVQQAPERKSIIEERAASPARPLFPASGAGRPLFGSASFLSGNPLSSVAARSAFNMSPTKRDDSRMGGLSAVTPVAHPVAAPQPPPEPKRSNVMSLLNADSEPPRPVKPEPISAGPLKAASPVQRTFSAASAGSDGGAARRDPSFGQPSVPQSTFRRESFSAQNATPSSMPPSLKHESSIGNSASSQSRKPDWATHVLAQTNMQPSPPTATLDRDGRSLYSHRSVLGLGARVNPSPPPLGTNPHSRTPSLSNPSAHQPREPLRAGLGTPHSSSQPGLQPNPYASQQASSLSQQQSANAQNHTHHLHNSSISSGPFPTFHQRGMSREDYGRQDPTLAARREREEPEARWRRDPLESDLQRRAENPYRQQDSERDRQQTPLHRTSLQPLQPPPFGSTSNSSSSSTYQPGRIADVRSQARNEVAAEMARWGEQERQQRLQQDMDRRRQQEQTEKQMEIDAARRRHPEEALYRRTPLGGSFGVPPPPPQPAPPRR